MVSTLAKQFSKEKTFLLGSGTSRKFPVPLTRITRLINQKGQTRAMLLPRHIWEDLVESLEYTDPKFWKDIEHSRKTPRVSSKHIEKELELS